MHIRLISTVEIQHVFTKRSGVLGRNKKSGGEVHTVSVWLLRHWWGPLSTRNKQDVDVDIDVDVEHVVEL